jgi:hypothetical protein
MHYIDVSSGFKNLKSELDPFPLIVDQSDGILISLMAICRITDRKTKKSSFKAQLIVEHREKYLTHKNCNLWIDSGGFNLFEKWNLSEENLENYIDVYNQYMSQHDQFDRIFSLDFPVIKVPSKKNNEWFNSKGMLKKWNRESQLLALETIRKIPQLRDKYTYVYQFKTPRLYKIWNDLYRELELGKEIVHRAIGGLVGIQAASRKSNHKTLLFSAVIGPAYKCFADFLESDYSNNDFTLHFLGVSNKIDQFVVILLEKLFTEYLKDSGNNGKAIFSIDTRAHSTRMDKNIRREGIFSFDIEKYHNTIHKDYRIVDIPDQRLKRAYSNGYDEYVYCEIIDKMLWNENVKCTADFYPLGIYSNNNLIKYFDYFISHNRIIDIIYSTKSRAKVEENVEKIFLNLLPPPDITKTVKLSSKLSVASWVRSEIENYENDHKPINANPDVDKLTPLYDIFKSSYYKKKTNLDNKIKESIGRIYEFHKWFVKDRRDPKKLERLMTKFIKDIGLKNDLK